MSGGTEATALAPEPVEAAPERDWAEHRSALRMPELRSALERLHQELATFLKDTEQP
jgi:hypothetical protein